MNTETLLTAVKSAIKTASLGFFIAASLVAIYLFTAGLSLLISMILPFLAMLTKATVTLYLVALLGITIYHYIFLKNEPTTQYLLPPSKTYTPEIERVFEAKTKLNTWQQFIIQKLNTQPKTQELTVEPTMKPQTSTQTQTIHPQKTTMKNQKMTEAKAIVITRLTMLYAGTDMLKAGKSATNQLIKQLFPNADLRKSDTWTQLEKQIGWHLDYQNETYYACERLDHKHFFQECSLRRVNDDELVIIDAKCTSGAIS